MPLSLSARDLARLRRSDRRLAGDIAANRAYVGHLDDSSSGFVYGSINQLTEELESVFNIEETILPESVHGMPGRVVSTKRYSFQFPIAVSGNSYNVPFTASQTAISTDAQRWEYISREDWIRHNKGNDALKNAIATAMPNATEDEKATAEEIATKRLERLWGPLARDEGVISHNTLC